MSNPQNGALGAFWVNSPSGRNKLAQAAIVAQVNVADPAGMVDLAASFLSMDATGRLRVQGPATGIVVTPFTGTGSNSVGATGSAAAPGAGAAIVTIPAGSLPAGTWDIQVFVYFSVAGTADNAQLQAGATVVSILSLPASAFNQLPARLFRRTLDGATALSINAIAADAAGTYRAELIATRVA